MRTHYQFIHFVRLKDNPKTSVWECRSNQTDAVLGKVSWHGAWRQYCFHFFNEGVIFNRACFQEIIDFLDQLMVYRAEKKRKEKAR